MAWSVPMTAVANETWTSDQFNTYVRDNLNATAPGIATTAGRFILSSGANALMERAWGYDEVTTSQNTTSTSYTDLATVGPSVTLTTGTKAMVMWSAQGHNSNADQIAYTGMTVSGATTKTPGGETVTFSDSLGANQPFTVGGVWLYTDLTAGSNTFKLQYRVSTGTGTFANRTLFVIPFS